MEKSVALFYCKNISKIFEKVLKNLLTNTKRCVIIGYTRKGEERKEVNKMKTLKNILNWFVFLLTGKGKIAEEMIEKNIISYEGQGRDKYGK